uniref:tryptophan halogenase family protein n=1 Tax=Shewanella gaetbuli TaxID=220752 RepID=UPI003B5B62EC
MIMNNYHPEKRIKNIVIVGGGSAGWMAASALSKVLKNNYANIHLVESHAIGTVSVGEATIPQLRLFNSILGIDEDEFMRQTQGTFKLGIDFIDWKEKGSQYLHSFGTYGTDMDAIQFHHYWLKMFNLDKAPDLESFSLAALAARAGRFSRPQNVRNSPLADIAYAYHFDATLYAKFLKKYSINNGVKHTEAKVQKVNKDADSGFITSIDLDNGDTVAGDLFIDCTGFKGLLIEQAMGIEFEDWSHWLPCDSAVAMPCESAEPIIPYTRSTAQESGWTWRIPLQHRVGNGYVYPSRFVTDEQAVKLLEEKMENKPLAKPNFLKWKTGIRKRFWEKNCIAIGLSAGFLEPLESTGLHLIQSGIAKLLGLFPHAGFNQVDIDTYNQQADYEARRIRDFIILHYKVTNREDSEFWRYCKHMSVPEHLQEKIALYKSSGRIYRKETELFNETSWLAVMHGQGIRTNGYHPLVDTLSEQEITRRLNHIKKVIDNSLNSMPMHEEFIARNCQSAPMT